MDITSCPCLAHQTLSLSHSLQACGNVLYAMKKMTSDKAEVRAFLSALAPKIEACEQHMTAQELANAFYGAMSAGHQMLHI